MRLSTRFSCLILLGLTAIAVAAPGMAGERHDHRFDHRHPRRDQLVDRTHRQNRRITHQVREGELTHAQAHAIRASDRSVVQQQRADAKVNGGYITKSQQRTMNQQLNANSQQIGH
ncbi:hypothetical protein [Dyella sp. A6]|uniref:hypothetical protein n=1 Tax=Dyella aluminiiresistens TaxID=3069105 RepID=UPI002E79B3B5|nr:hypothetical protein [Dyella sp. A6]